MRQRGAPLPTCILFWIDSRLRRDSLSTMRAGLPT